MLRSIDLGLIAYLCTSPISRILIKQRIYGRSVLFWPCVRMDYEWLFEELPRDWFVGKERVISCHEHDACSEISARGVTTNKEPLCDVYAERTSVL